VTYKGPKIDATTKTRREIELPLPRGATYAEDFILLQEALGFRRVAEVRKLRKKSLLHWQDKEFEIAIDDVAGVGHYVELEIVAGESEVDEAKSHLASLAESLGLSGAERRSYLELLLERKS
jgi:adenylate cyclase class 2